LSSENSFTTVVYQQEGIYAAEDIEIVLTDTNAVLNEINIPKVICQDY
jgi:hypothetical protein